MCYNGGHYQKELTVVNITIHVNDTTIVELIRPGISKVTRLDPTGNSVEHTITTGMYQAIDVAIWLYLRDSNQAPLIQESFPYMSAEDREFLMTGLTPEAWNKLFPKEDE